MVTIYPTCAVEMNRKNSHFFEALSELTRLRIIPFSSARGALVYGLRALGVERMDEILVPPFLAHCVTSALGRTAFPTMTPSRRTRAILVFHQFGYPQRIEHIEKVAFENEWFIVNDCAHAMLSGYRGKMVLNWGDFAALSFSKFYPCNLGGGLVVRSSKIQKSIEDNFEELKTKHAKLANRAYEILLRARENLSEIQEQFEIDAVYGYLPELVACPSQVLAFLPDTIQEIQQDANRRRDLFKFVQACFPDRVPDATDCDVVPFAIPVAGEASQLEWASLEIKKRLGIEAPVLHFDFSRNMLRPDYRKSLVIGCHGEWTEEWVTAICEILNEE
jgi:hypothetical protein